MSIVSLFCEIDDFFLGYENWKATHCLPETTPMETRRRPRTPHPSEVMTLLIAFHQICLCPSERVAVSLSWIRRVSGCVIRSGFPPTKSSQGKRNAPKPLWGGFMDSNFT